MLLDKMDKRILRELQTNGRITNADREFHFNQMLSVSFSFFLPQQNRVSE